MCATLALDNEECPSIPLWSRVDDFRAVLLTRLETGTGNRELVAACFLTCSNLYVNQSEFAELFILNNTSFIANYHLLTHIKAAHTLY